jgi:hypothetical protein
MNTGKRQIHGVYKRAKCATLKYFWQNFIFIVIVSSFLLFLGSDIVATIILATLFSIISYDASLAVNCRKKECDNCKENTDNKKS